MRVIVPLRTVSEANRREHWARRHRRAASQRRTVRLCLQAQCSSPPSPPLVVTMTRIAPRQLDTDNLARALKAVRDGVADWLDVDDAPGSGVQWRYEQRKGGVREYAVEIRV